MNLFKKKKLIIYEAHCFLPSPKPNLDFNLNKVKLFFIQFFKRKEKEIGPSNPIIIY